MVSRRINRVEGAKRPFGCERSEPGSGSAERSAIRPARPYFSTCNL